MAKKRKDVEASTTTVAYSAMADARLEQHLEKYGALLGRRRSKAPFVTEAVNRLIDADEKRLLREAVLQRLGVEDMDPEDLVSWTDLTGKAEDTD